MNKKLSIAILGICVHVLAFVGIFAYFGIPKGDYDDTIRDKFTGVLERGAVIRVLENDTAIKQGYFKQLVDAFNLKYKEYDIVAQDANMDQYLDLETDGPYGYGPDVLYQANDRIMRYAEGQHVLPLPIDKLSTSAEIDKKSWASYKIVQDDMDYYMGVPVNIQVPLMYYRKSLLPDDSVLTSWSAMYQYSQQRKEQGKFGYMKSLLDSYFSAGYLLSYGGYIFGGDNTDVDDIGLSKGNAEIGASVIRQLATVMDERAIDHTITAIAYSQLAKGNFFATMTTPDVYTLFIDELMANGYSREGAIEELGVAKVPKLPLDGDLSTGSTELIDMKTLGGVGGYAISSYTKYPNASLAFVEFATSYDMILSRNEYLGVVPARLDVSQDLGGLALSINKDMSDGNIVVMPSVKAMAQFWPIAETFFADIAQDPYRDGDKQKYKTLDSIKQGLKKVDQQLYDAIHILN